MSWYSTGTVNVTSGSPNIVGVGTTWAEHVSQGWAFYGPDKELYEVLSVNNNTSITLARNYGGSTLSGQTYQLIPTQGETRALTERVLQLLQDVSDMLTGAGAGKFPAGAVGTPSVAADGDTNTGLYWAASDVLAVATGGVEAMRADASQRVGIGVTPSHRLHVRQDQNATTRSRLENASTGAAAVAQVDAQADQARGVLRAMGSNHSTRPNRVEIGSETNHSVAFLVNDTLRGLWNSIGLGIGTTPVTSGANATLLQVGDPLASGGAGITLGATTTNDIAFSDATSGVGQYAGLIRYSHSDDSMRFWAGSSEKVRLTSTGTFHVGNYVSSTVLSAYPITEPTAAVYHNFYGHNIAPATCTSALIGVSHTANTVAASFTLPDLYSFRAYQGTVGAGSTLTRAVGFAVFSDYSKALTNIGFRCEIPIAANNYAFYSASGVQSYLEGNLGLGTGAPTRKLDINADSFRVRTGKTPASVGAAGVQGEICWDASFIYVCVATNTWRRVAHATW